MPLAVTSVSGYDALVRTIDVKRTKFGIRSYGYMSERLPGLQ